MKKKRKQTEASAFIFIKVRLFLKGLHGPFRQFSSLPLCSEGKVSRSDG